MHIYKQLVPPSAVSHCMACSLVPGERHLVVVRGGSLLQVFSSTQIEEEVPVELKTADAVEEEVAAELTAVDPAADEMFGSELPDAEAESIRVRTKLVLVGEWHLDGQVLDLKRAQTLAAPLGVDSVVIAFKFAKVVVMVWSSETLSFSPVSVHYYEKNLPFFGTAAEKISMFRSGERSSRKTDNKGDISRQGDDAGAKSGRPDRIVAEDQAWHFADPNFSTTVNVDPQSTCMCVVYQRDQLAFLTFNQSDSFDELEAPVAASSEEEPPIFSPSFLINAAKLDDSIANIISTAFLYEYTEPTLALIFEPTHTWVPTLPLHKDTVHYLVLSLDLQQRSSTSIVSVSGLPYDIEKVVPLPAPARGSLLIGANHIIHIDASGKPTCVSVNQYSNYITKLSVNVDRSHLNLQLESCTAVVLEPSCDVLLVTNSGESYIVKFTVEGRKVYGMDVVPASSREQILAPSPSCACSFDSENVFVGSNLSNGLLLSWNSKSRSSAKVAVKATSDSIDNMDDDEDLYGDSLTDATSNGGAPGSKMPVLEIQDRLRNYGPLSSLTIGKPYQKDDGSYELVATTGSSETGALSVFSRTVKPTVVSRFSLGNITGMWAVAPRSRAVSASSAILDSYMFVTTSVSTSLYKIGTQFTDVSAKCSILTKTKTIAASTTLEGAAIIQVHERGVSSYDSDFTKGNSIHTDESDEMIDDPIVSASFADPYIFILSAAGKATLIRTTTKGTSGTPFLEKVPLGEGVPETLRHGSISLSLVLPPPATTGSVSRKRKRSETADTFKKDDAPVPVGVFITEGDQLIVSKLGSSESLVFDSLSLLPPVVYPDQPRDIPGVEIAKVLLAPLGDHVKKEEYLFVLTVTGELYLYRANLDAGVLLFVKAVSLPSPIYDAGSHELIPVTNIGSSNRSVVILGPTPFIVVKAASAIPRVHRLTNGSVSAFTPFTTEFLAKGFAYLDGSANVVLGKLDSRVDYTQLWPVRRIDFGESITSVAYHETAQAYVVATCSQITYDAVDEDNMPIPGLCEDLPKAESYQGSLKLISPLTWTVIDEFGLEPNEVILTLKSVMLEVSEKAKRKKEFIAFGTSFLRGEDLAAKGNFYIFDAIEIVPEPGKPETSHKLKELGSEAIKGAVTAICGVNGHLLVTQGQKVVVRNIQEDNSIIPVAFMDLNVYVSSASSVKNILLLSDAIRSVRLAGFGQEPYRMVTMSKDSRNVETAAAELIVNSGNLYVALADRDQKLHLLEYSPEELGSQSGQRLMRRAEFFTGRDMLSMISVPLNSATSNNLMPICGCADGSLFGVVPVSESTYRTLFVVQQQIIDKDDHTACLNPRQHRALGAPVPASQSSGRSLLDYDVISRYFDLSVDRRQQFARKVSKNGNFEVINNLQVLESTLDYL